MSRVLPGNDQDINALTASPNEGLWKSFRNIAFAFAFGDVCNFLTACELQATRHRGGGLMREQN
jgi:hypothetical protein